MTCVLFSVMMWWIILSPDWLNNHSNSWMASDEVAECAIGDSFEPLHEIVTFPQYNCFLKWNWISAGNPWTKLLHINAWTIIIAISFIKRPFPRLWPLVYRYSFLFLFGGRWGRRGGGGGGGGEGGGRRREFRSPPACQFDFKVIKESQFFLAEYFYWSLSTQQSKVWPVGAWTRWNEFCSVLGIKTIRPRLIRGVVPVPLVPS